MTAKHWLYLALHAILVLIGAFLCTLGNLWVSIGTSLIAAGVAGGVIFLYLFVSSRAAERLSVADNLGLRAAFSFRSVAIREEYETRLRKAHEQIDILGFGLRSLREDLGKEFTSWADRTKVRILLQDPEFPDKTISLGNIRDLEEDNPPGSIEKDVRAFIALAAPLLKSNPRFKVRLCRAIPSINYFRIDNEAFWGPYFVKMQSRNTPTFLVDRSGTLFSPLAEHFDQLWSERFSRDIPASWMP